jgi:hypothetical protein
MRSTPNPWPRRWALGVAAALLIACGGGGGDSGTPSAPATPPAAATLQLQSALPAPQNGPIDPAANFTLSFSEPVDQATVTQRSVRLVRMEGSAEREDVASERLVSGAQVTVRPASVLKATSSYRIKVDTALRSQAGNLLAGPIQLDFGTASAAVTSGPTWGTFQTATGTVIPLFPTVYDPDNIAIDNAGNALVSWAEFVEESPQQDTRPNDRDGYTVNVWVNRYDFAAGAWGTPFKLWSGPRTRAVDTTRVAFDAQGNAVIVWGLVDASIQDWGFYSGSRAMVVSDLLFSRYTAASNTWSAPERVPGLQALPMTLPDGAWALQGAGVRGVSLLWQSGTRIGSSFFQAGASAWSAATVAGELPPGAVRDPAFCAAPTLYARFNSSGQGFVLSQVCGGRQRPFYIGAANAQWQPIDPPEDPGDDVLAKPVSIAINTAGEVMLWWGVYSPACLCLRVPQPRLFDPATNGWKILPHTSARPGAQSRLGGQLVANGADFSVLWGKGSEDEPKTEPAASYVSIFSRAQERWTYNAQVTSAADPNLPAAGGTLLGAENGALALALSDCRTNPPDTRIRCSLAPINFDASSLKWSQPVLTIPDFTFLIAFKANPSGVMMTLANGERVGERVNYYGGLFTSVYR